MLMSLLTVMFTVEVCHQTTDMISSMLLSALNFGFSIAQILIKITTVKFISYDNPSQKSVASLIIKFHKVV